MAVLIWIGLTAGCAAGRSGGGRLSVVATTPVLAALARSVTAGVATVDSVMPAGSDPHGFVPSARDRQKMLEAGLLVTNGAGLEQGLRDVIDQASSDGVSTLVAVDSVHVVRDSDGGVDPHFWQDPEAAAEFVRSLAARLARLDPSHAAIYRDNAARKVADLKALTSQVEAILAQVPVGRRLLVSNHDAYRYFAQRFDLTVVGSIIAGRSTQATPSAAHLADLAQTMRSQGICVVFAEESESAVWAQALAETVGPGTQVVKLYAATLPAGGYDAMIRQNATRIADALARCA